MNVEALLERMTPLSKLTGIKDLKPLSAFQFPGKHCPLMGAATAIRGIRDAQMVILGTDECAYYTKDLSMRGQEFGGLEGRCVSIILNNHSVTFGSKEDVLAAFDELVKERAPRLIFLVSTCVVEIIGDDIDAFSKELSERYQIKVLPVHTEHFKCEDHIPGIERAMTACVDLMEPLETDGSVNVIGQRYGVFEETELWQQLAASGVRLNLAFPGDCSQEDIARAPKASVNIVTSSLGLPLAKAMEERFQTPYVYFDKQVDPVRILEAYEKLYQDLDLPLPDALQGLYQGAEASVKALKPKMAGTRFVYGNTPLTPFDFSAYLMGRLGMEGQIIQVSRMDERDQPAIKTILEHGDPLMTKSANIAPLRMTYDVIHPQLYLGHEFEDVLRQKGIVIAHTDRAARMHGFEVCLFINQELERAKEASDELN